MPVLSDEARAKVNLTLRVNGRRADGYHDLESVVAFADCADRLTLTPGSDLDLKMLGPLAQACGDTSDNLVLKAARLLAERVPDMKAGSFSLHRVRDTRELTGLLQRLRDRAQILPRHPLVGRRAQQIGRMERRDGADGAACRCRSRTICRGFS